MPKTTLVQAKSEEETGGGWGDGDGAEDDRALEEEKRKRKITRRGATKTGWQKENGGGGGGGEEMQKRKRCNKREQGFLCVLVGEESKGERGERRSEGLREGEEELILLNSHANSASKGDRGKKAEGRGRKRK